MKRISALLPAAQPGEHPAARGFTRWLEEHGHDWQSFDQADRYELWLVFVDECIAEGRRWHRRSARLGLAAAVEVGDA